MDKNGVQAERYNRLTGETSPLTLAPSSVPHLKHGFASVARFFPGARDLLAEIDDELMFSATGVSRTGKALCFEDQYSSTGGQLYELMAGHDRFVADLRPLLMPTLQLKGLPMCACAHPYDLCTERIAREVGVVVTDLEGHPLRSRLDLTSDVAWLGYANQALRDRLHPKLEAILRKKGLL